MDYAKAEGFQKLDNTDLNQHYKFLLKCLSYGATCKNKMNAFYLEKLRETLNDKEIEVIRKQEQIFIHSPKKDSLHICDIIINKGKEEIVF